MSKEKRGGARLEKPAAQPKKAPPSAAGRPAETKGLPRGVKITLIVLAVILAVAVALTAAYKNWAKLPEVALPDQGNVNPEDGSGNLASSVQPVDSDRKKEFYTFLIVGRDTGGGGNTDTLMLGAYDIPNQKLNIMSIPRDTMVDARHPGANRKINGVWNLGLYYADKDSDKEGIDYLKEAVGDMMGFTPDFHVIVNWKAFGRLVDAIGGVDFEVPFHMQYKDPLQDLYIDQPAGYRHLTGDDAMQVVRWRHDNSYSTQYRDGDLGRIRTQQALMKEIIKKCLKIENVAKLSEFAEIFTQEVETDLTLGNIVAFAERAVLGGLSMDNVNFVTLPVTGAAVKGASYVQAKPEELLGILNQDFNPYTEDLVMENLDIMQYSSSAGYYVYKGTGTGKAPAAASTPKPGQGVSVSTPKPEQSVPASTPKPSPTPKGTPTAAPSSPPPEEPSSSPAETAEPENTPAAEPPAQTPEAAPTPEAPEPSNLNLGIPID